MAEVFCFGDSNTWGYHANEDSRFPWNKRWTGKLQKLLGEDYHIIENGKCGRTTAFFKDDEQWISGLFEAENLAQCYGPMDICIIMLGTNDVKDEYSKSPLEIAEGLEKVGKAFLKNISWSEDLNKKSKILIVVPPCIENIAKSPFLNEFGLEAEIKSRQLGKYYRSIAKKNKWELLDVTFAVKVDSFDGIHLNEQGHRKLSEEIHKKIIDMGSDNLDKRIESALEKNKDKYIDRLLKLVSIDTHDIGHGIDGGLEAEGQEYLATVLSELGAVEIIRDNLTEESIIKCKELYNEGNLGHNYTNRYNLYGTFKGESEKSILFNGHIDHMPAENEENWCINPLKPEVIDGKITGLGVADMKAGLMASILSVELLKDAGIELPITVKVASVCDEEGGGNGSLCAAMSGVKADAVVVCEPTNYELIAAHMGWVFFQVEVEGIAVHSGLKLSGVNAIEKAGKIMNAINELEHKWLLKYKHPLLPPPSSNVGVIYGGEAGSTIPDYCCFKTCVHYLPRLMSHDQVVEEYTGAILKCCEGDEWLSEHKPKITIYQTGNPFEMDLEHSFVSSFENAYEKSIGKKVKIVGSPAGCDSRTWYNIVKCPTLQYGPGSLEQCHTVNEYVSVEQYLDAIKIYANLILEWANDV